MRIRSYTGAHLSAPQDIYTQQAQRTPAMAPLDRVGIQGLNLLELPAAAQDAFQTLLAELIQLKRDLDTSRKRIAELEKLADTDILLPIMNRRAFVRELMRFLSFAERYDMLGSLLYFDLNGMKQVNDHYSHAAGDALLRHFVDLMLSNIRDSDALGRLGGDEFGVILAHLDREGAEEKAQDLLRQCGARPLFWEGQEIPLSFAIGVHQFVTGIPPQEALKAADQALAAADTAMYRHKRHFSDSA
ncbi:MAG TPA: GGDEF domain-containing protein [Dongiaceae bacterium]|nr:GGDEF domain-containing protein [Dongiaceae bacterium]